MELHDLKANVRTNAGKGSSRALRREDKIPGILYGPSSDSVSLSLNIKEMQNILKKGRSSQLLVNLIVINGETYSKPVIVKELQFDPLSKELLHVDFFEISMDRKIKVKVPVETEGKAVGVEAGGILQVVRRELEILCYPNQILNSIVLDVTNLEIGDSIHVKDISIDEGIDIVSEVNFTVLTISAVKIEEEVVEEEIEGEEEIDGEESTEEKQAPEQET